MSDKGLVFESTTSFAIGCSIELAVHAQYQGDEEEPSARPSPPKSEFITSEGVVVSCAPRTASAAAAPVFEVTLLFASLRSGDRRRLRHLASRHRPPMPASAAGESPASLLHAGFQGPVLGLN